MFVAGEMEGSSTYIIEIKALFRASYYITILIACGCLRSDVQASHSSVHTYLERILEKEAWSAAASQLRAGRDDPLLEVGR